MPMIDIRARVRLIVYRKLPITSIYSDSTCCIWPDRDRVVEGSLRISGFRCSVSALSRAVLGVRLPPKIATWILSRQGCRVVEFDAPKQQHRLAQGLERARPRVWTATPRLRLLAGLDGRAEVAHDRVAKSSSGTTALTPRSPR
jgi:hypothetical protein